MSFWLGVLACTTPPADPTGCDRYRDVNAETYALCVTRAVRDGTTAAQMQAACSTLGASAGACRTEWLQRHTGPDADLEANAALCAGDAECGFNFIDAHPSTDLRVQIDRCERYSGKYLGSCVAHAANRWATAPGGPEDIARTLAALPPTYDFVAGTQWGLVNGRGRCPADTRADFATGCEQGASAASGATRGPPPSYGNLRPPDAPPPPPQ